MKRALTLVFLALVFVGAVAAQQARPSPTPVRKSQASGQVWTWTTPRLSPQQKEGRRKRGEAMALANVCYTMNSFVFARTDGGDAVRLVAQRTCTPAAKFRVKKATVTMTTPGR